MALTLFASAKRLFKGKMWDQCSSFTIWPHPATASWRYPPPVALLGLSALSEVITAMATCLEAALQCFCELKSISAEPGSRAVPEVKDGEGFTIRIRN